MVLTIGETIQAEPDWVTHDGVHFQFTRAATLRFVRSLLYCQIYFQQTSSTEGTLYVLLLEDNTPRDSGDFANFVVDDTVTVVEVNEDGASFDSDTLDNYTSLGSGLYSKNLTSLDAAAKVLTAEVVIRAEVTHPDTHSDVGHTVVQDPSFTDQFDIPFWEVVGGAVGSSGGQTVKKAWDPLGETYSVKVT